MKILCFYTHENIAQSINDIKIEADIWKLDQKSKF